MIGTGFNALGFIADLDHALNCTCTHPLQVYVWCRNCEKASEPVLQHAGKTVFVDSCAECLQVVADRAPEHFYHQSS